MTTFHPDRALRDYQGHVQRPAPIWKGGPVAPWHATVEVTPLELRHARGAGPTGTHQFEIRMRWEGTYPSCPNLPGTPTPDDGQRVQGNDAWLVDDQELAVRMAKVAIDELAIPSLPDLRELEKRARGRALI